MHISNNRSDRSRSTSSTSTSTLSSLVTAISTAALPHKARPGVSFDDVIDPCRQPVQQKPRPPSPQDFLHPSLGFSTLPHQVGGHYPSTTDHPSFSYPTAAAYNIHFPSPLFSVSSSIQYAAPMTSQPACSPFATGVGFNNTRLSGILSPSLTHARPSATATATSNIANDTDAARRGPPTPLPFTHPYSAGYYISTGLTPLYATTQFRAIQGDPFFGAVSHLTPTPSCSSFEAAQQGFIGAFPSTPLAHMQSRNHEQPRMTEQFQEPHANNGNETSIVQDNKDKASQATDIDQKPSESSLADLSAAHEQSTLSPQSTREQVQAPMDVQPQMVNAAPFEARPQFASIPMQQTSVSFEYPISAGFGTQREFPLISCFRASDTDAPTYTVSASAPNFAFNGHPSNRLPSVSFPSSAPVFSHPGQMYSIYFSADGQAHYMPNAMPPQAITDMNGSLTYAYPPQAFQPAQPMPHHAWARQQNAFAYHYGETDAEVDEPTPDHRHAKSVTPLTDRGGRGSMSRYDGRDEDAEGEDDDDYDDDHSLMLPPPPTKSMKRSRSYSRMSSPDTSAVSDVEWQPRRKTAKKVSSSTTITDVPRKSVDSKRPSARKPVSKKWEYVDPDGDVGDGEIRYTSNAEAKQTERAMFYLQVPRSAQLETKSSQSGEYLTTDAKKRKKSVKELGLKSLQIANRGNGNLSVGRENEQGVRRVINARGFEEHDSEDDSGEDRRVSLNSNQSGRSAGVASTASDLTSSTFGPQTPLSANDISTSATAMRKQSRRHRALVDQKEMPYRTFTRPMSVQSKNGAVKPFPAGSSVTSAQIGHGGKGKSSSKARSTARVTLHHNRSDRYDEEDEDEERPVSVESYAMSSSSTIMHSLPAPTTSSGETDTQSIAEKWTVNLPRRVLILPPTALFLGALIGISRGGSRARLRFLAENAHRQPTTIQGWYFYTKTRNYRILFGSLREGAKTGLTLGAATALYVLSEEGVRSLRNRLGITEGLSFSTGSTRGVPEQVEERSESVGTIASNTHTGLEWLDGGIAGSVLGGVISGFNRFPAPLFARTVLLGTTFGALEGCLRIAQDKIGRLKEEAELQRKEKESEEVTSQEGGKVGSRSTSGA
ncbi:hypothetical protein QFC19_004944 [Naganishia cerealis]|uniref:Uncharacterized protein n=1 Tax=Naganishia cerealis TaxID=610337 RepID=A0ACC2VSC6_9TREE|nr:hypothetical protein QFC19_004944 [Naganishia cerealis]